MSIDRIQIEQLAHLARLDITEEEKSRYADQISSLLDYFGQLSELNTDRVEPLAQVFESDNIVRPDVVAQGFSEDAVLAEAPDLEKRQIKVPSVITKSKNDNVPYGIE